MTASKKIKKFFRTILGPGLITGASDDDPSEIATYSQVGAQSGFKLLWATVITFPLMTAVQETCARIGLATGLGLTANLKKHYSIWLLSLLALIVLIANILNIGADLAGMAAAAHLVVPFSEIGYVIVFPFIIVGSMIYLPYPRFASYMKWLALVLVAYLIVPFTIHIDWGDVLKNTFIPALPWNGTNLTLFVAFLGTTISPYLFFWQADEEIEEYRESHKTSRRWMVSKHRIHLMQEDTTLGMFFSNVVSWFIIIAAGATLHTHGITTITTAAEAAAALKPIAGNAASLIFALGIVGTGFLAIPVLAGSVSYVVAQLWGWREGLDLTFREAKGFYSTMIAATILGASISVFGINPIQLLIFTALLFGLISPPLIFILLLIANNKTIMGNMRSGVISNVLMGITLLLTTATSVAFIWSTFR
ncbi:MAG: Nramp family divalent metal transporter [Patescibacteria group bacterium]|nr:Nramp family divalent metal transporter [Patescibacteria group bacterium]MDE2438092.1 Nramp family divalent metal transporter [Patescibacteria group bacterium]